jgi:hypothetical protein
MIHEVASDPTRTLAAVRRILLAILLLGIPGTGAELLLLGHFDGWRQQIPLVLLTLALVALVWHRVRPGRLPVRVLQLLMLLFIVSGGAGVLLHYRGNVAFELEMYPSTAGFELFRKAIMGATPALAPGAMFVLGLAGFAYTYGHPGSVARRDAIPTSGGLR